MMMSMGASKWGNPAIADGAVNVLAYERSGLAGRGCLRTVVRRGNGAELSPHRSRLGGVSRPLGGFCFRFIRRLMTAYTLLSPRRGKETQIERGDRGHPAGSVWRRHSCMVRQ